MRHLFATLALLGALVVSVVGVTPAAWAQAAPAATASAPAAAAAAAPDAAAPAAPAATVNKGDNAWVMVSAALVILMSIPGLALF